MSRARVQVQRTFTGPQDVELAEHMAACNARGPLVAHVAKLIPKADCSGFDALARVFSGTVKPGDRVRVLGEVRPLSTHMRRQPRGFLTPVTCTRFFGVASAKGACSETERSPLMF